MTKKTLATRIIILVICIGVLGIAAGVYLSSNNGVKPEVTENEEQQKDIMTEVLTDTEEKTLVDEEPLSEKNKYILPESDVRLIEYTEILDFDTTTLNLAKNEIYARHGYIFETDSIAKYFQSCGWYSPSVKASEFQDSVFNQYEIQNIKLLEEYELASGYTYPLEVKAGKTVKIDLNGDGKLEEISFQRKEKPSDLNGTCSEYTITVNGEEKKYEDTYNDGLQLYVVDINTSDKSKELCAEMWEPNDYIGRAYWQYSIDDSMKRIGLEGESLEDADILEANKYAFLSTFSSYDVQYLGDGRMICSGACEGITRLVVGFEVRLTENDTFESIDRIYNV